MSVSPASRFAVGGMVGRGARWLGECLARKWLMLGSLRSTAVLAGVSFRFS